MRGKEPMNANDKQTQGVNGNMGENQGQCQSVEMPCQDAQNAYHQPAQPQFQAMRGAQGGPKNMPMGHAPAEHVCSCQHEAQGQPQYGAMYGQPSPQEMMYGQPSAHEQMGFAAHAQAAAPQMPPFGYVYVQGDPRMMAMYGSPQNAPQYAMQGGYAPMFDMAEQCSRQAGPHVHEMNPPYGYAEMPVDPRMAPPYVQQQAGQPWMMAGNMPSNHAGCSGHGHGEHDPKHDQNRYQYGQLMDIVGDIMSNNPDASKIFNFLQTCDTQLWKGILIGAVGTFLLTNPKVKSSIFEMISGLWGGSSATTTEEPDKTKKSPAK